MSRSIKTNKARKQRQLAKAWVDAINFKSLAEVNKHQNAARKIQINGERYGNERKSMAKTKVRERRAERKRRNSEPLDLE